MELELRPFSVRMSCCIFYSINAHEKVGVINSPLQWALNSPKTKS